MELLYFFSCVYVQRVCVAVTLQYVDFGRKKIRYGLRFKALHAVIMSGSQADKGDPDTSEGLLYDLYVVPAPTPLSNLKLYS